MSLIVSEKHIEHYCIFQGGGIYSEHGMASFETNSIDPFYLEGEITVHITRRFNQGASSSILNRWL
uniref:AlNc14C94G5810 protein n=1 Tax=Albugo laibachii Nc14 TaxID=890382 RepID=F0WGT3_9STRA|nr:AlNc14C94G5810 [Albugo laibachii Nc14]|eukprot:CCA20447.1 AlNc14C94G5810 [Albugo laibachii Nc14]